MKGTNYSQAFYELIFTTHFGLLVVISLLLSPANERRDTYTVGKNLKKKIKLLKCCERSELLNVENVEF